MPEIDPNPTTPTLYTCQVTKIPKLHPCQKADTALTDAGIEHERIVYGDGRPFGIGTKGTRPDLLAVSGQEKLPVLVLPGGESIAGSGEIIRWARSQA